MTAPAEARFPPGELVDGRYRVEHLVGEGGMGAVYRARDESRGVPVALKVVRAALAEPTLLLRLQREAELLARGAGGGVVRVEAMGQHRSVPFVVLAWVDGDDLNQLLGERGRLELDDALALAERLARTLAACHEAGVIHRDVKPANVLLPRDAKGIPDLRGALLADFGLAWSADVASLTRTSEVLGTPAYMAPEQTHGAAASRDCRVDVWGVGAILFHGLTGGPPFLGTPPEVVARLGREEVAAPSLRAPGLAPEVDRVVLRALARDPARRYPTALDLADDLARLRRGEPPLAGAPPPSPVGRRATRALTISLAVAVALLGAAWAIEAARRGARASELEALVAGHWAFAARQLAPWNLGLGRGPPPSREALEAQTAGLRTALELAPGQAELQRGLAWLTAARRRLELRVEPPATDAVGALGDALTLLELGRATASLQAARAAADELPLDAAAVAGRALASAPGAVLELPPELLRRAPALASPVRETLERTQADALRRAVRGEPGPSPADVAAAVSRLAPALPGAAQALADARRAEVDASAEAWVEALTRASSSLNPADVLVAARRLGGALSGPPVIEPGPALTAALDRLVGGLSEGAARAPSGDEGSRRQLQATRLIVALYEELPGDVQAAFARPARSDAIEHLLGNTFDLSGSEVPHPVELVHLRLCFDQHELYDLTRLGERVGQAPLAEALARWPRSRALRVVAAVRTIVAYDEEVDAGVRRDAGRMDALASALEEALAPEGATLDLAEIHLCRALRILGDLHLTRSSLYPRDEPEARACAARALELLERALPILLVRGLVDEHHEVLNLVGGAIQQLHGRAAAQRLWEETAAFDRARLATAEADPQGSVLHVLERLRTLTKTLCRLAEEQALEVDAPGPALDLVLETAAEARERARSFGDPTIEGRAVAVMLLAERRAKLLTAACARLDALPPDLHRLCDHRLLMEAYECTLAAGRPQDAALWLDRLKTRFPVQARGVSRQ